MQFHELKRHGSKRDKKLIGRGGKRGKTSGRGTKGQLSRAGRKLRTATRDIIKKIPKKRGHRIAGVRYGGVSFKAVVFNVGLIDKNFSEGELVSPESLAEKGLLKRVSSRRSAVKILGEGDVSKKLFFRNCLVSAGARAKIEKAGGSVEYIE